MSPKSGEKPQLDRRAFSSAIMCKPIKAGPEFDQLTWGHRLFLQKKEEELTMRPVLPWHIPLHGGSAQTYAVPRSPIGPNALPDRRPTKVGESLCLHHCEASFHQLEPTLSHRSSAVRLFQAGQGSVQSHNWVFEVLFPQSQSPVGGMLVITHTLPTQEQFPMSRECTTREQRPWV